MLCHFNYKRLCIINIKMPTLAQLNKKLAQQAAAAKKKGKGKGKGGKEREMGGKVSTNGYF